jgi:hypothetical protein
MLWFEDETFEDCGSAEMAGEPNAYQCQDVWLPALPIGFATEEGCKTLALQYSKAAEEFKCAVKQPPAMNDDVTIPTPSNP